MPTFHSHTTKTTDKQNEKNTDPITAVWQKRGFSAFLETFVLAKSLGFFSNFGAENPPHRKGVL